MKEPVLQVRGLSTIWDFFYGPLRIFEDHIEWGALRIDKDQIIEIKTGLHIGFLIILPAAILFYYRVTLDRKKHKLAFRAYDQKAILSTLQRLGYPVKI